MNLCRLAMTVMTFYNINDVNNDTLNKWCLYTIEMILKLRSADIINCHNNNIIDKYV